MPEKQLTLPELRAFRDLLSNQINKVDGARDRLPDTNAGRDLHLQVGEELAILRGVMVMVRTMIEALTNKAPDKRQVNVAVTAHAAQMIEIARERYSLLALALGLPEDQEDTEVEAG